MKNYNKQVRNRNWCNEYEPRYVSPSDIGLHNMIKTEDGKIHFIDFEYGGIDDISKLLGDLTSNPNHVFTKEQENELFNIIAEEEKKEDQEILDTYWHERYMMVKPIIQLKWCFIMTNKINYENANSKEKEIIEYYERLTMGR